MNFQSLEILQMPGKFRVSSSYIFASFRQIALKLGEAPGWRGTPAKVREP